MWGDFPTDALTKVVKALSGSNDFATDKTVQTAVAEISKILSTRSPELEEAVADEKQASTLKRFKGLTLASVEDIIEPSGKNSLGTGDAPVLPNDNIIEKKSSGTDATTVTDLEVESGDKSVTASGTDTTTVTDLQVEEGDKSVTASGTDTTTVTELEVEEGDKSVEKAHTSKLLRGLRVAGIEG
jgi:uncharacterized protein with beta-barrel porin domain